MKILSIMSFLVFGCLMVGCTNPATDDEGEFAMRLKAAGALRARCDQEEALSKIALDAADANCPAVAMKCLGRIYAVELQGQTASGVAVRLAKVGANKAALKAAGVIADLDLRDKTLKQLANPDNDCVKIKTSESTKSSRVK